MVLTVVGANVSRMLSSEYRVYCIESDCYGTIAHKVRNARHGSEAEIDSALRRYTSGTITGHLFYMDVVVLNVLHSDRCYIRHCRRPS